MRNAATREGVGVRDGMGIVVALGARLRFGVVGTSGTLNVASLGAIRAFVEVLESVRVDFKVVVDFDLFMPFAFGSAGSAARFFGIVLIAAVLFKSEAGSEILVERRRDMLKTTF